MGMAAMEAEEHEEMWREMAIKEWGHSIFCNVLLPGGKCNCDKPNKKAENEN